MKISALSAEGGYRALVLLAHAAHSIRRHHGHIPGYFGEIRDHPLVAPALIYARCRCWSEPHHVPNGQLQVLSPDVRFHPIIVPILSSEPLPQFVFADRTLLLGPDADASALVGACAGDRPFTRTAARRHPRLHRKELQTRSAWASILRGARSCAAICSRPDISAATAPNYYVFARIACAVGVPLLVYI